VIARNLHLAGEGEHVRREPRSEQHGGPGIVRRDWRACLSGETIAAGT
jgi:hypothetical protein